MNHPSEWARFFDENTGSYRYKHKGSGVIRDTFMTIGKGRYLFLGGGEGWGILVFFSQKIVGPPLRFNKKTPDPPPLGD